MGRRKREGQALLAPPPRPLWPASVSFNFLFTQRADRPGLGIRVA
jgi:hypothetical protein